MLKCTFGPAVTSPFNDFALFLAQGWKGTWPCFPLQGAMRSKSFATVPKEGVGVVGTWEL